MPIPTVHTDRPLPRVLLRERVQRTIRTAILDGTLQPGERLHDDQLIAWLGVSRTPIREAITQLAAAGLIDMSANRYTKVAVPEPTHVVEALHTLGVLFGNISRFTVHSFADEQRAAVADRLGEEIRLVEEHGLNQFAIASVDVYRHWLEACPNRGLVSAYQHSVDGLAYRLRVDDLETLVPRDRLCEDLTGLRDAVLADDPIAAETAMERIHTVPQRG